MSRQTDLWNGLRPIAVDPLNRRLKISLGVVWVIATVLSLLIFRAVAPGAMTTDTFFQLDQALGREPFNDWHPVVMSVVWKLLIDLTGTISSMAAAQIGLAWICTLFTSYYLLRLTRRIAISGLGLLLLAAPNSANIIGAVWKDTHMALALYLAVICILIFRIRGRYRWGFVLVAVLALIYATVVRKNAGVAAVPLIFLATLMIFARAESSRWKTALLSGAGATIVFALTVVGIGQVINQATDATRNSQITQVMIDDLIFAVPQSSIDSSQIASDSLKRKIRQSRTQCYEVGAFWDAYWKCYGRGASGEPFTEIAHADEVTRLWVEQVPQNLPRYLDYRFMTTSAFLFTTNLQFASTEDRTEIGVSQYAPKLNDALRIYVVDFGLEQLPWIFHGWFWLFSSAVGFVVAVGRRRSSMVAACVFIAGILYLMSFFPTAPASDYRYIYWTALSTFLGWIVLLADEMRLHDDSSLGQPDRIPQ